MSKAKAFQQILSSLLLNFLLLPFLIVYAAPPLKPQHVLPARHDIKDPDQVKAFVDAFFTEEMPKHHIPGAVFVLVQDDTIMLAQGYGYTDLTRQTPIDPETTGFRVQSISKLFTATALMQLYERGQLDLDADVNTYLHSFQVAPSFSSPVTTAQLLTHTAGFDQVNIGVSAFTVDDQQPLGDYLAHSLPKRIMPPGTIYAYSNHGMSLAGYLVEEISGKPFAQYITDNILEPLDMDHSSFVLSPDLALHMATEYNYREGSYEVIPFDYLNTLPAGGLNATSLDMAHFMIAHLQDGRYLDRRILNESTAQEMHRQHFTAHPQLPGMAYGFHEYYQNGLRALEHGGTWAGSTSELMLFPEQKLGFFTSCTRNDEGLRDRFTKQFIDYFFPAAEPKRPTKLSSTSQTHNARFVGSYRSVNFIRTDFFKLGALLNEYQVTAEADGTLLLHYPSSKAPTRWMEIQPLLFQRITPTEDMESSLAAFRADQKDIITHLFVGTGNTLIKLAWYETRTVQFIFICSLLLIFLSGWLVPSISSLLRRATDKPAKNTTFILSAQWLAGGYSALACLFLIGMVVSLVTIDPNEFNFGIPKAIKALLIIPWLLLLITLVLLLFVRVIWRRREMSLAGQIHYSLVTLAALLFIPFLLYWNLFVLPR